MEAIDPSGGGIPLADVVVDPATSVRPLAQRTRKSGPSTGAEEG